MTRPSNIDRIVGILGVFDGRNAALPAPEIVKKAGMKSSTGYGLIRALTSRGYLEATGDGCFRLGLKARQLAYAEIERPLTQAQLGAPTARVDPVDAGLDLSPDLLEMLTFDAGSAGPPWRIGVANASSANPWRKALLSSLVQSLKRRSGVLGEARISDADDDPETQVSQISEMLAGGIDALILSAAPDPAGALCNVLEQARTMGVPVIGMDRRPARADLMTTFVTASDDMIGKSSALWVAEWLGGAGRIWMLSGIDTASPAIRRKAGACEIFDRFVGITIEAGESTDWTKQGGARVIEELLARYCAPPDAVWCDSGLQGFGAMQAFLDRGLVPPPHTGGDINGVFRMALTHRIPHCAFDYPAAMGGMAVDVTLDLLRGRMVPRRVEAPVPAILPRGHETPSVKADIWAENYVRWDLPDDATLSHGHPIHVQTHP